MAKVWLVNIICMEDTHYSYLCMVYMDLHGINGAEMGEMALVENW